MSKKVLLDPRLASELSKSAASFRASVFEAENGSNNSQSGRFVSFLRRITRRKRKKSTEWTYNANRNSISRHSSGNISIQQGRVSGSREREELISKLQSMDVVG